MHDPRHNETNDKRFASERLARALSELRTANPAVPPEVDKAVLRAAREHLRSEISKPAEQSNPSPVSIGAWLISIRALMRRPGYSFVPWVVSALVFVVAGALALIHFGPAANRSPTDLNRDGRVDILDALALAQQIERGAQLNKSLDLNGDGAIDRRDAEALAMHAVRIENGRPL